MNSSADHPALDAICRVLHSSTSKYIESDVNFPSFSWTFICITLALFIISVMYMLALYCILSKTIAMKVSRARYLCSLTVQVFAMFGMYLSFALIFSIGENFALIFLLSLLIGAHILGFCEYLKYSSRLSIPDFITMKQVCMIPVFCAIFSLFITMITPTHFAPECTSGFFRLFAAQLVDTSVFLSAGVYLSIALVLSLKTDKFVLSIKGKRDGVYKKKMENVWIEYEDPELKVPIVLIATPPKTV